ncbi:MAG TPA: hypothetical protein VHJ78_11640, partial [Actinomycetota bacterium]|nr:hypothetical protein [Actinomycetota bacterium]
MAPAFPTSSSTIASAALAGLILGVAVSSFLGVGILAGFVAVALAVGVFLALAQEGGGGKVVPGVSALSAMVFPLAVAELGEDGMLPAAAAGFAVLAAAHLLRGRRAGSLPALGLATGAVLHLGLLGSFLVLLTAEGNRLLPAMVLMAAAFETAYVTAAARTATTRPKAAGAAGMSQWPNPRA